MVHHGLLAEATWQPAKMHLAYRSAPILVHNHSGSDAPALIEMIDDGHGRIARKLYRVCQQTGPTHPYTTTRNIPMFVGGHHKSATDAIAPPDDRLSGTTSMANCVPSAGPPLPS